MRTIEDLVAEIRTRHFPFPPASDAALENLRSLAMPEDAVQFYSLCNGACLHADTELGGLRQAGGQWWRWVIIESELLVRFPDIGYDIHDSPLLDHQRHWVPVVDVMDGNYLSVSTEPGRVGEIIDCFHETLRMPGQHAIVGRSFTEMLESLLASRECFWLEENCPKYGRY